MVTLPVHPFYGQRFQVVRRLKWKTGQYFVDLAQAEGPPRRLPEEWTDLVPSTPRLTIDGEHPKALPEHLLELSRLVAGIETGTLDVSSLEDPLLPIDRVAHDFQESPRLELIPGGRQDGDVEPLGLPDPADDSDRNPGREP